MYLEYCEETWSFIDTYMLALSMKEHGGEWFVKCFTTYKGVYVSVQGIDP